MLHQSFGHFDQSLKSFLAFFYITDTDKFFHFKAFYDFDISHIIKALYNKVDKKKTYNLYKADDMERKPVLVYYKGDSIGLQINHENDK